MKKRLLSLALVLVMVFALLPMNVFAATPSYTVSTQYKDSKYYTALKNVTLTGDQRTDIVNVAKSQVGYHEGNSTADLGGGNTSGSGNYTEYNKWYGSQGSSWCAIFVSWCARQAGIPSSIVKASGYADCDDLGCTWHGRNADRSNGINYTPKAGDIIVFDFSSDGYCTKSPASSYGDHVGIVTSVSSSTVYTVEGNTSNKVESRAYSLTNSDIKGYAVPNYSSTVTCKTHSYDSGKITKAATCTASGTKTYTCTVCGATKTSTIAAKGHTWDSGKVTTAATILKEGIKTYNCKNCSATKTETVAKLSSVSGTCGDNLKWTLTSGGTLTISGTGEMYDYDSASKTPWYAYRSIIKTITVKEGATSIGNRAFSGCSALTSISLPTTVTKLGILMCSSCTSLETVTIPANVSSIGYGPFSNCTSLKTIKLADGNDKYSIVNGMLLNAKKTNLIQCPGAKTGSITIPSTVTVISTSAFNNCNSITSVTLTKNITINSYAFSSCDSLKTVYIKSGTKSIGNNAFGNCTNLTDIYFDGTQAKWNELTGNIGTNNESLLNATIHLNDHHYISKVVKPTCTKQGYTSHTCECGDVYKNTYVEALGHDYVDGICTRCGDVTVVITKQPTNLTAQSGTTGKFSVTATGIELTYQWQYQKPDTTTWVNSTAASGKTATFSVSVREAIDGYNYRCVVKDAKGNSVTSNVVTLSVASASIVINKQPTNLTAKSCTTGKFSVTATGTGLTYQWQYQKPGTTTWVNSTATSGKTATFSVSVREAINGYKYRCIIKDANGKSVTSNTATLTVTSSFAITKQPINLTAANGTIGKFSVTATGTGLTYQWQYQKLGTTTWVNSTAASGTTATFSVNARTAIDGYKYRCIVKDSAGNSITSNVVTLKVS